MDMYEGQYSAFDLDLVLSHNVYGSFPSIIDNGSINHFKGRTSEKTIDLRKNHFKPTYYSLKIKLICYFIYMIRDIDNSRAKLHVER